MPAKTRVLSALTAASYLLATSVAALFHDHACSPGSASEKSCCASQDAGGGHSADHGSEHRKDDPHRPDSHRHSTDAAKCPICQFLAQESTPVDQVAAVISAPSVAQIAPVVPSCPWSGVFTAWHSRGPPTIA